MVVLIKILCSLGRFLGGSFFYETSAGSVQLLAVAEVTNKPLLRR